MSEEATTTLAPKKYRGKDPLIGQPLPGQEGTWYRLHRILVRPWITIRDFCWIMGMDPTTVWRLEQRGYVVSMQVGEGANVRKWINVRKTLERMNASGLEHLRKIPVWMFSDPLAAKRGRWTSKTYFTVNIPMAMYSRLEALIHPMDVDEWLSGTVLDLIRCVTGDTAFAPPIPEWWLDVKDDKEFPWGGRIPKNGRWNHDDEDRSWAHHMWRAAHGFMIDADDWVDHTKVAYNQYLIHAAKARVWLMYKGPAFDPVSALAEAMEQGLEVREGERTWRTKQERKHLRSLLARWAATAERMATLSGDMSTAAELGAKA